MKTTRKNEIINAMPSFSKTLCKKSELLPEMLLLQDELVNLTFNGEHAENAQLRIWDVQNHMATLNEDRGHVADELLQQFNTGCQRIIDCISGEIGGKKGEDKAMRSIDTIRTKHTVLRNIELSSGDHTTELDFVIFTGKAVFVIEVKNTARNIFIDKRGNYCRVHNGRVSFDKNIGEKMNDKAYLLRNVLQNAGIENPNIVSLVVFTNSSVTVTNEFPFIQHCYLSSLPHLVDTYAGEVLYTEDMIRQMAESVELAKYAGSYPLPLDVNQFKNDFADLMIALEGAAEDRLEPSENTASEPTVVKVNTTPSWLKGAAIVLGGVPLVGLAVLATIKTVRASRR